MKDKEKRSLVDEERCSIFGNDFGRFRLFGISFGRCYNTSFTQSLQRIALFLASPHHHQRHRFASFIVGCLQASASLSSLSPASGHRSKCPFVTSQKARHASPPRSRHPGLPLRVRVMQLKRSDSHQILVGYTLLLHLYRGHGCSCSEGQQRQCASEPSMFILFSSPKDDYIVQWGSRKTVWDVRNG